MPTPVDRTGMETRTQITTLLPPTPYFADLMESECVRHPPSKSIPRPTSATKGKMIEPHDDHFTSEDRKALTEIAVHMTYVRQAVETMKGANTQVDTKVELIHEKLDSRIRVLENWRWWIMGAALAGGGAAGLLSRFLGSPH